MLGKMKFVLFAGVVSDGGDLFVDFPQSIGPEPVV
jgi:hypothetical protein